MAGSISKEALLKILGENKDALAKLEEVTVKADELKAENPTLTVEIDAAKARAEAAILKAELKRQLGDLNVTVKPDVSQFRALIDRFLVGSEFAGGGSSSPGGLIGATEGLSGPMLAGIAVAVPAIEGLLVLVDGVASGLAAAAAGATAFGLLALPTFEKIKTAYTNISAAQTAYNTAVEKEKIAPTAANAKAVATALTNLKAAQDQAGPAATQAITSIDKLKTSFDKIATAFQPEVFKVFNGALKIANDLLPALKTPATDFANALSGLLTQFDNFTKSKGFQTWLTQFDKLIGPATTAIGHGVGQIVTDVGKLFTKMSAHDVVHAINIVFDTIGGIINGLGYVVTHLMNNWDRMSGAAKEAWKNIKQWFSDGVNDVKGFLTRSGGDLANWAQVFDNIVGNINNWFNVTLPTAIATAIHWFQTLPGRILSAIGNLGSLLFNAGKSLLDGLINGIKAAIPGLTSILSWVSAHIPSWKGPEDKDRVLLYPAGQAIMGGLIGGIGSQVPALQSTLSGVTRTISTGVGGTGGRGGPNVIIQVAGSGNTTFDALMTQWLRQHTRILGGGSVQAAFGKAGM